MTSVPENSTLYQRVGGKEFFVDLVKKFYEGVESDPILRPLYPEDLAPGQAHLTLFLSQYWGGPRQYEMERGHPRLRMRHIPYSIGQAERDAWFGHMSNAVITMHASPGDAASLIGYFSASATFLMTRPE